MTRYPRTARATRLKCIDCNAPVVETVDGDYACVDCGDMPIEHHETTTVPGEADRASAD